MKGLTCAWRSLARPRVACFFVVAIALAVTAVAQNPNFTVQDTPNPNALGNTLNAVAAISTSDAWAVGFQNDNNLNDSRTLIQHWNGSAWSTVPSPNPGGVATIACLSLNSGNVLTGVAPVSTNDVWAVGYFFGCTSFLLKPMVLHWNGVQWSVVPTPKLNTNDNAAFNSVVALSANDIYAVGYQPAPNGAVLTLIEHWNGVAWSVVPSPNGNNTGNVLASVTANSPTDIWAVGDQVAPGVEVRTLALHFNGSTWSVVPTPNPVHGGNLTQNVLTSVVAVAPNDVTAVGFTLANQTELTMVQHWDGTSWTVVPSPNMSNAPGSFNTLRGVTAVNTGDLYAVGFFANSTTNGQQLRLLLHFDGAAWSVISAPGKATAQQLNGVFARLGDGDVWVAGAASVPGTDPETGLLQVPITFMLFTSAGELGDSAAQGNRRAHFEKGHGFLRVPSASQW